MGHKPNHFLAQLEAKYEAICNDRVKLAFQMGLDAAMVTANEVLGLGPGRAEEFKNGYNANVKEIATLTVEDGKDDKELVYAKSKIDERVRKVVGDENFVPWDERYTM